MIGNFFKDFFDDFFDGLNFFVFFSIFSFEIHKILFFKEVLKMICLKLILIFQDLLTDFGWDFKGKAIQILDLVSGPFVRSSLYFNHTINLVWKQGSLEENFIIHTSITLKISILRFIFHLGAFIMAPSIASGTFAHISISIWVELKTDRTPFDVVWMRLTC